MAATVLVGVTVGLAALARTERARRATRAGRSRRARHFGLLADESSGEGVRRIALGQVDLALEMVAGDGSVQPAVTVHEVRKAIKRLRALLRLLEATLGPGEAARERGLLQDMAERLAGVRDADVMVATLQELMGRHPRRLCRRGVRELRAALERRRLEGRQREFGERAAIEADLLALRMRITGWSLPADGVEGGLEEGLLGIYRRGRAGHRRAGRGKADGLTLHRWRKHVKELRYAAEVLDLRTSPGKRAASSGRLAKLARRADELAETLGEEHDLAVLEELVRADTGLRRRKGSRRALLRAIARRRARLRERALGEGERIYGLAPGRMARRIARARARARARAHTRARARRLESV